MSALTLLEAAELAKAGEVALPDAVDKTAIVVGLDLRGEPALIVKTGDGREVRIPIDTTGGAA